MNCQRVLLKNEVIYLGTYSMRGTGTRPPCRLPQPWPCPLPQRRRWRVGPVPKIFIPDASHCINHQLVELADPGEATNTENHDNPSTAVPLSVDIPDVAFELSSVSELRERGR